MDKHGSLGNVWHGEIISGGETPWRLVECPPLEAAVEPDTRRVYLPRVLSQYDRMIARHERGHVKWPHHFDGHRLDPTELQFAVDLWETVVNTRLERAGLRVLDAVAAVDWSTVPVPHNDRERMHALLHMLSYRLGKATDPLATDFHHYYAKAAITTGTVTLGALETAYTDVATAAMVDDVAATHACVAWAKKFAKPFREADFPARAQLKESVAQERQDEQERLDNRERAEDNDTPEQAEIRTYPDGTQALGCMVLCDHTRNARRAARITHRGRCTDLGAIPYRTERRWMDGQIYLRRRASLSVVIDGSGSMSWTPEQLYELVATLPATTIAVYSEADSPELQQRGWYGQLCILARGGIVASGARLAPCGNRGSNTVDDYALAWLARQPMVRLWVSDGCVNAGQRAYQGGREAYWQTCARVQQLGRILRVADVPTALAAARGAAVDVSESHAFDYDAGGTYTAKLGIRSARRTGR